MNHTQVSGLKIRKRSRFSLQIPSRSMILLVFRRSGWLDGWIEVWIKWIDGPPFLLCPALVWLVCRAPVPDIPISAFQTFISTLALSQIGPTAAFARSFSPNWCGTLSNIHKIICFHDHYLSWAWLNFNYSPALRAE